MNMMIVRRTLACCARDKEISIDFGEQERITTYDGLESCILNSQAYEYEKANSRVDVGVADSLYDDDSSSSSSNNAFGSYSSQCTTSPQHLYVNEKSGSTQLSDVEMMKERFAKLLLGEDVTGGSKGVSTALALSNAITYLAASVFGELWKLEPLAEERKIKWRTEMDLLLSPTNHMIELVPARQSGSNGQGLEDIGHSILEAYSRVLLNLAHNILTRIGEVLQVDFSSNVNSPAATVYSSPISSDETLVYRSDEQS